MTQNPDQQWFPQVPINRPAVPPWVVILLIVLVVVLATTGTIAVVQSARLADSRVALDEERRQGEQLQATVDEQEAQIEGLQGQVEDLGEQLAQAQAGGSGGALEDLLGSGLEDLLGADGLAALEELLGAGGLGSLEDLLGEGGLEGLEDLLGEGGLGGLEDLLGTEGLGGLEDLLGGTGIADTSGCTDGLADQPDVAGDTLDEQIAEVVTAVQTLRGATFPEPLEPAVLTSDEVRDRLDTIVAEEYPAEIADQDQRILSALGAIPAGTDLIDTQAELLGDQVAGFYDPETRELVVRSDDGDAALDLVGVITLAHELEHALADAVVGLPDLEDQLQDEDAALAEIAVTEGDAVAVQTMFTVASVSPMDMLAVLGDPDILASAEGLEDVPPYLADSLAFPYVDGASYVCDLFREGGWAAVDAALESGPTTTAEIIFGDAAAGPAVDPEDLAGPDGWNLSVRRTFGAAQLIWLFSAPGGDREESLDDPRAAAQGWRGGEVTLWTRDAQSAVALSLVDGSGGSLCDAVTTWWERTALAVDGLVGQVACDGDQVLVGIGPDAATAAAAIGR